MARVSCSTTICAMGYSNSCIAALHSWVTVTHRGIVRFVTSTKPLFQAMLQTALSCQNSPSFWQKPACWLPGFILPKSASFCQNMLILLICFLSALLA